MKQIKVKELPVGYFVTDTCYPSSNIKFVSEENNYTQEEIAKRIQEDNEYLFETGEQSIPLDIKPKEIFGTKHIQLVAANIKDYSETDGWNSNPLTNGDMYFNKGGYSSWNNVMPKKEYEKVHPLIESGKDFFIYRVSEEK